MELFKTFYSFEKTKESVGFLFLYFFIEHNGFGQRLRLYLPGNGGLLSAIALMCTHGNGFPKTWKVRWEGLKGML